MTIPDEFFVILNVQESIQRLGTELLRGYILASLLLYSSLDLSGWCCSNPLVITSVCCAQTFEAHPESCLSDRVWMAYWIEFSFTSWRPLLDSGGTNFYKISWNWNPAYIFACMHILLLPISKDINGANKKKKLTSDFLRYTAWKI